jgi:hypothetical protein
MKAEQRLAFGDLWLDLTARRVRSASPFGGEVPCRRAMAGLGKRLLAVEESCASWEANGSSWRGFALIGTREMVVPPHRFGVDKRSPGFNMAFRLCA